MLLNQNQTLQIAKLLKLSVKQLPEGYRILKDGLGVGSKYDVDVNAKEIHAFPEELHGIPPVIFKTKKEVFDVLSRLVRYAAQTILIRGKWGGCYLKEEIKTILKS
jgi:hypothetical protein